MTEFYFIGGSICIYLYFFTDHLKIQWDKFAQFFAFMCFVIMAQDALSGGARSVSLADVHPAHFLTVFWEDAVFMVPMYFAFEKYGKNKFTISLAVILSLLFALGHLYHGLVGAIVTAFYPYFLSYRYAKKTSIGTVMACHVLYDLMLYYSVIVFAR